VNEEQTLAERRDRLYQRLETGYSKIDQGLRADADRDQVQAWEDFWLTLLQEYEAVCRELQARCA
jgi:hypothetical protein